MFFFHRKAIQKFICKKEIGLVSVFGKAWSKDAINHCCDLSTERQIEIFGDSLYEVFTSQQLSRLVSEITLLLLIRYHKQKMSPKAN
jgi:hypothetical protein